MYKPSQISLCKLVFRHPFQRSPRPISPFQLNSLAPIPTQLVSPSTPSPNFEFLNQPTSYFHHSPLPNESTRSTQFVNHQNLSSSADLEPEFDQNKVVDEINLKFAEAREEIEMAQDSKETVYFNEESEAARTAVKEVLDMFDGLLKKVPEKEKGMLQYRRKRRGCCRRLSN